jgi:hypothetical protein
MKSKFQLIGAVLLMCVPPISASAASAANTLTVHASFAPDKLGAPTNLSATAAFGSTTAGPQSPAVKVIVYGPRGLSIDTRGTRACTATPEMLEEVGPSACSADSRVGFGSGVGLFELASKIREGRFTLEFFLAPTEHGQLAMLIYVNAFSPVAYQTVVVAHGVQGTGPYGMGVTFDVPIPPALPEALPGWEHSVSITLGATDVAYYRTVHGKRRLVHVRGIVTPKRCPRGGFPVESKVEFADGSSAVSKTTIPCPPA